MRSTIIIASFLVLSAISSSTIAEPSTSSNTLYDIPDSSISVKCKSCIYPAYIDSSPSCSTESDPPSANSATTKQHLQCFENFAKNKTWAQSCLITPSPPAKKACELSEVNAFHSLVNRQAEAARNELAGVTTTIANATTTPTIPVNATLNATSVPTLIPTANVTTPTSTTITSGPPSTAAHPPPSGNSGGNNSGFSGLTVTASGTVVVALSALIALAAAVSRCFK
ncbi:hypothetical protein EC991_002216 [Linnemannia zychae]|nr:hypothetical protein EC991_002216 [Linnemannia zychae]